MSIEHIDADKLKHMLQEDPGLFLLDVRTPPEYLYLGHIHGATLIPLHDLPTQHEQLDPKRKTVVLCQHGVRSMDACLYLQHLGFSKLYNLMEGMAAWDGPMEREPLPEKDEPQLC